MAYRKKLYTALFATTLFMAPLMQRDSIVTDQWAAVTTPITTLFTNARHGERKKQLLKSIKGDVLEINSQVGENLKYVVPTQTSASIFTAASTSTAHLVNYSTIEPNALLHNRWEETAKKVGLPPVICRYNEPKSSSLNSNPASLNSTSTNTTPATLSTLAKPAAHLLSSHSHTSSTSRVLFALANEEANSRDAVIFNFTLSSAPDNKELDDIVTNAIRILRPGGRLYFMEMTSHATHASESSSPLLTSSLQTLLTPIYRFLFSNCHLNRPTAALIADRPEWNSVYMEQWPNTSPDVIREKGTIKSLNARRGITLVTRNEHSWKGLHGIRSIVSGVAVKKRETVYVDENDALDEVLRFGKFGRIRA